MEIILNDRKLLLIVEYYLMHLNIGFRKQEFVPLRRRRGTVMEVIVNDKNELPIIKY